MKCTPQYNSCVEKYMTYLTALPKKWAEMIACNICNLTCDGSASCEEITDCQTLTSLSNFSVTGNKVCFTYVDERGIHVTRCFTVPDNEMYDADGTCLTDDWFNIDEVEKWQAIVDKLCDCCNPTTTTSTTTTTTAEVCVCGTYSAYYAAAESAPVRLITVNPCDGGDSSIGISPGQTVQFCACYYGGDPDTGIIDNPAVGAIFITFLGDDCFAVNTTTTTSTTTTTTAAPTTTTTTTTTSSTTTTTTADPCPCILYQIDNTNSSAISGSYNSCNVPHSLQGFLMGAFGTLQVCCCEGSISVPAGVNLTNLGTCPDATTTTTTTTTTTSTTTTSTSTTTTSSSTTTTTTADPNNIIVHNESLDVVLTGFTMDTIVVPGSYANPGNPDTYHSLVTDGTVDLYLSWSTSIGGQHIEIVDTQGVTLGCEDIFNGDPTPYATWFGVDMTGPNPLIVNIMDGGCP